MLLISAFLFGAWLPIARGADFASIEECRTEFVQIYERYRVDRMDFRYPPLRGEDLEVVLRLIQNGDRDAETVLLKAFLKHFQKMAETFAQRNPHLDIDEGDVFAALVDIPVPTAQDYMLTPGAANLFIPI